MLLPSEQSLRSATHVASIAAAVALGAAAGWVCFQCRGVELADVEWNPVHLYFRLVTGESLEDVAARSLEQPVTEPVFAFDRDLQIDPELIQPLNGPALDPDSFSWHRK